MGSLTGAQLQQHDESTVVQTVQCIALARGEFLLQKTLIFLKEEFSVCGAFGVAGDDVWFTVPCELYVESLAVSCCYFWWHCGARLGSFHGGMGCADWWDEWGVAECYEVELGSSRFFTLRARIAIHKKAAACPKNTKARMSRRGIRNSVLISASM